MTSSYSHGNINSDDKKIQRASLDKQRKMTQWQWLEMEVKKKWKKEMSHDESTVKVTKWEQGWN